MKKQPATKPKGKLTAAQYRRNRREWVLCMLLKCLLGLTLILFAWITDLGCAFGWIKNAKAGENWPSEFVGYGQMMIGAAVLLTAGTVLVLFRKNWIALGTATAGMVLWLISMLRVTAYAADSGFYSRIMEMPAATLYRRELLPTLVPYACLLALALLQFFSLEAKEKRNQKRLAQDAAAPSVLGE